MGSGMGREEGPEGVQLYWGQQAYGFFFQFQGEHGIGGCLKG